jgi:hypothetical protein
MLFAQMRAPAVLGNTSGYVPLVKQEAPHIVVTQTCTGNKGSSSIPERGSVISHKSH